jgi:hypothetical protein
MPLFLLAIYHLQCRVSPQHYFSYIFIALPSVTPSCVLPLVLLFYAITTSSTFGERYLPSNIYDRAYILLGTKMVLSVLTVWIKALFLIWLKWLISLEMFMLLLIRGWLVMSRGETRRPATGPWRSAANMPTRHSRAGTVGVLGCFRAVFGILTREASMPII